VRVGSFDIDAEIQGHVRRSHGIAIGERTAEQIKIEIGSAMVMPGLADAEVRGRDLVSGLPKTIVLTAAEIREAINPVVTKMIDSVIQCLGEAPPELAQDFLKRGMYVVGGGALLKGMPERIAFETQVPVVLSDDALEAVVLGAGACVEKWSEMRMSFMDSRREMNI
jgi:rod shape-determining protein MreB